MYEVSLFATGPSLRVTVARVLRSIRLPSANASLGLQRERKEGINESLPLFEA